MIKLIEIPCGKSLTIGFVLPIDYDLARIEELEVYLEDEILTNVLADNVVRCEITSDQTAGLEGIQKLSFRLDDSEFGVSEFYAGDIRIDSSEDPITDDPINKGFDLLLNLAINEAEISIESVFYNYYKGESGAITAYTWIKNGDGSSGIGLSSVPGVRTPGINTHWITIEDWCVIGEDGHNTGAHHVKQKKQKQDGVNENGEPIWVDMLEETTTENVDGDCPPYVAPVDPYQAHMSVHESDYDFTDEYSIPINFGNEVTISTPTKETDDYGYLFISVPADKSFKVFNMFHTDVTAGFLVISPIADNRTGFQNNLIYRDSDAYDISGSGTLFIIIG